jgi:hypothetical protein
MDTPSAPRPIRPRLRSDDPLAAAAPNPAYLAALAGALALR